MPDLEIYLLIIALFGLIFGTWAIVLARGRRGPFPVFCGRILFVFNLLSIGGSSLVAASHRADGLVPLGLLAGGLVVGMLWEPQLK